MSLRGRAAGPGQQWPSSVNRALESRQTFALCLHTRPIAVGDFHSERASDCEVPRPPTDTSDAGRVPTAETESQPIVAGMGVRLTCVAVRACADQKLGKG